MKYESKHTGLLSVSVVEIGTDRIVNGMFQIIQADNDKEVEQTISDYLHRMPKDGTCELTVSYPVND